MNFSETYARQVNDALFGMLSYAEKFYDLEKNPTVSIKPVGCVQSPEKQFWTPDEFECFLSAVDSRKEYSCWMLYQVLYYTGCRVGEALALYTKDIDFVKEEVSISKTFHMLHKKEYLTTPKTMHSIRTVRMPHFLCELLREYVSHLPGEDVRLFFNLSETHIDKVKRQAIFNSGVKYIRTHDFRHSATAYLASEGIPIEEISKRMGHSTPDITFRVYSHVYIGNIIRIAELENQDFSSWGIWKDCVSYGD